MRFESRSSAVATALDSRSPPFRGARARRSQRSPESQELRQERDESVLSVPKNGLDSSRTVVSDKEAAKRLSPPRKLDPGRYASSHSASVGYDSRARLRATSPRARPPRLDPISAQETLRPRRELSQRRMDGERPGAYDKKRVCCATAGFGCHTLERIVRSPHDDADGRS